MRIANFHFIILMLTILLLVACGNERSTQEVVKPKDYEEPLLEANKHVVRTETQHIEDFLHRYKWDVQSTGSGLRYMIYEEGDGPKAANRMIALVEYTVKLITGDIVYSSKNDGLLSFIIGKGDVISGLEEAILLMNVGDKAKFIIPSHLAYGLVGDGDRIPGKATLIYDIKLVELKQSN